MTWTLEHVEGLDERPLDQWGLASPQITRISQAPDTLSLTEPGGAYDAPPLWAFDDTLRLKRDGVVVFSGRVGSPARSGSERGESRSYTVLGPWSWLDQIVYQQLWQTTNGASATLTPERRSRIIVGQDDAGAKRDTAAEIVAAVQWAIDNGAAIAIGTIDAGVTIPYQELVDVTCAELIRACLRWTPDAQAWWDYATTPHPTLHIRRRANLAPATLALDPTIAGDLDIRSRDELRVPAVVLKYEQAHTVDGETYTTTAIDKYPPAATGAEPRALVATIDLAGSAASTEEQKIQREAIIAAAKSFWKKHVPALAAYADANLTIANATVTDAAGAPSTLDQYLLEGAVNDWMGVDAAEVTVSCQITYNGSAFPQFTATPFSVTLTATNATKDRYTRLVSFDAAEEVPAGLAAALYEALSFQHWQGEVGFVEAEVSGLCHPGNTLRLTGGLAAWATMDAMVQQVIEDIDTGSTRIVFGPPEHLGPQDLIAQLRANRGARASWRRSERATAKRAAQGGLSTGPQKTAQRNATIAPAGEGGGGRIYVSSATPATEFPTYSEALSAVIAAYGASTPKAGDMVVLSGFNLHYAIFAVGGVAWTGALNRFAFAVGGQTYYAIQVGPKGFW